jgi:hypothetical protein
MGAFGERHILTVKSQHSQYYNKSQTPILAIFDNYNLNYKFHSISLISSYCNLVTDKAESRHQRLLPQSSGKPEESMKKRCSRQPKAVQYLYRLAKLEIGRAKDLLATLWSQL